MIGEFVPTYSTNNIWRDEDMTKCLTVDLETIESDITALETGKADTTHTHSGYALASHEHTGYAAASHSHSEYADVNHTHTGYAASSHTHSYNDLSDKPTTLPANGGDADTVDGKHASEFAAVNHEHTGYAATTHTHSEYASATDVDALQNLVGDTSVSAQISAALENVDVDLTGYATETYVNTQVSGKADSNHTHTLSSLGAAAANHVHNVFSSLTELGITTFPTTMYAVNVAMPDNSMIIMDTRVINGEHETYSTEVISDWGTTENGIAIISKGITAARLTMQIITCTSSATTADIIYGNYAYDTNAVNWESLDDKLDARVAKNVSYSAVDLNTIIEPGLYYVYNGTTDLNFPVGNNGHLLVMSDGTRTRQVFFRSGTVDTNNFHWYSRGIGADTTLGVEGDGWSQWWLISGSEKIWNGGTVLNSEINIGSRYGCQSWVVVARLQNTGAMASVVIPRHFLTNDTDLYRFQIADETAFISFYIYYKSDNDVYLKVIDQTDSEYTTLKYVYRMS